MNQYSNFDGSPRVYDDNGNFRKPNIQAGEVLTFDALNRVVKVSTSAGGPKWEYIYDADNRRVGRLDKSGSGTDETTYYAYNCNWQVCEELDSTGATMRQYAYGPGIDRPVSMRDYTGASEERYYYHSNSQGFIGALTNDSGTVVEYYEYKMLGKPTILAADKTTVRTESAYGNTYMFQGRRYDHETGLYHFRNRYYDPETGEFISIDPSGLWTHGQGNGYSAFGADAWNRQDPLGLDDYANAGTATFDPSENGEHAGFTGPLAIVDGVTVVSLAVTADGVPVDGGLWYKFDAKPGDNGRYKYTDAQDAMANGPFVSKREKFARALDYVALGAAVLATVFSGGGAGVVLASISTLAGLGGAVAHGDCSGVGYEVACIIPWARIGGRALRGMKIVKVTTRTNRAGEKGVRIVRSNGSVADITKDRVKEFTPNTHPEAPAGTLQKVKFDNAIEGSKGYKRAPTEAELKFLEGAEDMSARVDGIGPLRHKGRCCGALRRMSECSNWWPLQPHLALLRPCAA